MADWEDWLPLLIAILTASASTLVLVTIVVFNVVAEFLFIRGYRRVVNTMAHFPAHHTVRMVVKKSLGIEPTENMDFYETIASSSEFTVNGYGQHIDRVGLVMEAPLRLSKVLIYNYKMVFGHWPSKNDPLPSREDIDAIGAQRKARDAAATAAKASEYLRRYNEAKKARQRTVPLKPFAEL